MKLNKYGFATVEIAVAIVVLVLLGGVGYYVYSARNDDKSQSNKTASSQTNSKTNESPSTIKDQPEKVQNKNQGYVVVKEWGIAVRIGDKSNAEKIEYEIRKSPAGDDAVYFLLNKDVSSTCREIGFGLVRSTTEVNYKYVLVNNTYYASIGMPAQDCFASKDGEAIKKQIFSGLGGGVATPEYELIAEKK